VKDSNGNILNNGDTVTVTKDLKIKGMAKTLKRGEALKNIKLTDNADEVECRIGKSQIVLKTCFLKKG
ncbi:MAG: PhnA protein, partial [Flavobacteriaceae bacterium CG1_02_35_72]